MKKNRVVSLREGTNYGGHPDRDIRTTIVHQAIESLWTKNSTQEHLDAQIRATVATLAAIDPADVIEGQLAAQLIACNAAAAECYRRAMLGEQTFEGRRENLNQANRLSRTYAALVEALNRHRGKGQQKVTVEHVHVHAGGQAVVGSVTAGGRVPPEIKEQLHATQQLAHDASPAVLGEIEADLETVPIPGGSGA